MTSDLSEGEIRERLDPLFRAGKVRLAILFGSRGLGRARPESDVDLAFLADREVLDRDALFLAASKLLGTDRVDVIDLLRAPPLLAMSAVRTGRVLYERVPGDFAEFASLAVRRYADTAKLRRLREQGIRQYLSEKGL